MQLGILGPRGTHSEAAAVIFNQKLNLPYELVTFNDISEVLNAVEDNRIDAGFVPVENSLEGSINITLDTLARSDSLVVTHELVYPVHNCLAAKRGVDIKNVTKIYSHSQPISQCRNYLRTHLPDAEVIITPSTSRAAEIVAASDDNCAAVCSQRAAELNGLIVIANDIQDNMANSTRFFEVTRRNGDISISGDKTFVICQIDGKRAGALYDVLGEFAHRGVNMTRIESRPARTELGAYIFFFDLENTIDEYLISESIAAVKRRSIWLKNLGSFRVISG